MSRQYRNCFGKLLVHPDQLRLPDRVRLLRELAGRLQAADDLGQQWLGAGLSSWLRQGGDLPALLGIRPPRGSRNTAQRQIQNERTDRLLLELARVCGTDRAASAALRADTPPPAAAGLVAELLKLRAPKSPDAFSRARRKLAPHTR